MTYRDKYYENLNHPQILDYGTYLNCEQLLGCQTPLNELCNGDELQFQIVHQVEELWMKLIIYSLVDVLEYLQAENTLRVLTLFKRVHGIQRMMIQQLDLLETMSPREYQEIRLQLGNGSGQESPGFQTLLRMPKDLWHEFNLQYLSRRGLSVADVYDGQYSHDESYAVAEALVEFDELMQKFRANHLYLIQRSIGLGSSSLKGRPVELLANGCKHQFFPELWAVRSAMTDAWGQKHGRVREKITPTTSTNPSRPQGSGQCPMS
jgi:tryptophan 2,3-dioxygenase